MLFLAISRPQVRNIYLQGRMILPRSLIPSDKYFLKNLTFVVRISTRVATSSIQSNSSCGRSEDQQLKSNVLPGLPDGKSRRLPLVGYDWNGDVATRVDMRTTKYKFLKKYLSKGMSVPGKIMRP